MYKNINYVYKDEISKECIVVRDYGSNMFENLFFHENILYYSNDVKYRQFHINKLRNQWMSVRVLNTDNKCNAICYIKFKCKRGIEWNYFCYKMILKFNCKYFILTNDVTKFVPSKFRNFDNDIIFINQGELPLEFITSKNKQKLIFI